MADDLFRYLQIFGAVYDDVHTEVLSILELNDIWRMPIDLLPILDCGIGWPTNIELDGPVRRRETYHAVERFKKKSRLDMLEEFFENLDTGWTVNVHPGWPRVMMSNSEPAVNRGAPYLDLEGDGLPGVWCFTPRVPNFLIEVEIQTPIAPIPFTYTFEVDGFPVSYTSVGGDDVFDIRDGLVTAAQTDLDVANRVLATPYGPNTLHLEELIPENHYQVTESSAELTLNTIRAHLDLVPHIGLPTDVLCYNPTQNDWHCLNGLLIELIQGPTVPAAMVNITRQKVDRMNDILFSSWANVHVLLRPLNPESATAAVVTETVLA